jgi:uncharacterized protein (DUF2249 family)
MTGVIYMFRITRYDGYITTREAVMKELNVTEIVPRERHPLIFRTFDELPSGNAFVLVNDHDPKPLYYQFLHERDGLFSWEYLRQGPDLWKVKITKNSERSR